MSPNIIANGLTTPDGTTLYSLHRHDFKGHTDANGEFYFIDGGFDYVRTSYNKIPAAMHTIFDTDAHELIRQHFHWGTYGKDGNQPLTQVLLKDMETSHIKAILATQSHIPEFIRKIFNDELVFRLQQCFSGSITQPE
jgi:hypothetical protein